LGNPWRIYINVNPTGIFYEVCSIYRTLEKMFDKNHISYPLLSLLLLFGACHLKPLPKRSIKDKAASLVSPACKLPVPTQPEEVAPAIDTAGFKLTGFLDVNNYKLQYESSGFLNGDSLKDKVVVLQEYNEGGIYNPRLTIVLLGKSEGFSLYSKSQTIMPPEYSTENDYKIFDTEEVKIEEGKLVFDLYAIGPNGHIYFDFSWINNKLVLHELTGNFMGAGSHSAITYLAKTETEGMVTETTVNTMREEMPSDASMRPLTLRCSTNFENFEYDRCLQEITK
jgi:hypothetical protein